MKQRLISLILCAFLSVTAALAAVTFKNETLKYVIQYKWGLVQKNAATATLRLINKPTYYDVMVTASTLPWADAIYQVRDTLISHISKNTFKPISYAKITHEKKRYRKDALTYKYVGNHAYGRCVRWKSKPGVPLTKKVVTCSATGPTYDMVSIFYYIRMLDFSKLSQGKVVRANIFSGSSPEIIKIKSLKQETVKIPGGKKYRCYHLQFTFTSGGKANSSAPMNAWITVDTPHIPVKLVGELPIGQVRCFLTSAN